MRYKLIPSWHLDRKTWRVASEPKTQHPVLWSVHKYSTVHGVQFKSAKVTLLGNEHFLDGFGFDFWTAGDAGLSGYTKAFKQHRVFFLFISHRQELPPPLAHRPLPIAIPTNAGSLEKRGTGERSWDPCPAAALIILGSPQIWEVRRSSDAIHEIYFPFENPLFPRRPTLNFRYLPAAQWVLCVQANGG